MRWRWRLRALFKPSRWRWPPRKCSARRTDHCNLLFGFISHHHRTGLTKVLLLTTSIIRSYFFLYQRNDYLLINTFLSLIYLHVTPAQSPTLHQEVGHLMGCLHNREVCRHVKCRALIRVRSTVRRKRVRKMAWANLCGSVVNLMWAWWLCKYFIMRHAANGTKVTL